MESSLPFRAYYQVAMARKLEYFVHTRQVEQDIRLFPLVLTASQVQGSVRTESTETHKES